MWKNKRRFFLVVIVTIVISFFVFGIVVVKWPIPNWAVEKIRTKLNSDYLNPIGAELKELKVQTSLWQIYRYQTAQVSLVVHSFGWVAELHSELDLNLKNTEKFIFNLTLFPQETSPFYNKDFKLMIDGEILMPDLVANIKDKKFTQTQLELNATIGANKWAYNGIRLEWEKLFIQAKWRDSFIEAFSIKSSEIRLVKEKTLEGVIDGLELSGEFRNLIGQGAGKVDFHLGDLQLLVGENYFEFPLKKISLQSELEDLRELKNISTTLSWKSKPLIHLQANLKEKSFNVELLETSFEELKEMLASPMEAYQEILRPLKGHMSLLAEWKGEFCPTCWMHALKAKLKIFVENYKFDNLQIKNWSLMLPYNGQKGQTGNLNLGKFSFQKMKFESKKVGFRVDRVLNEIHLTFDQVIDFFGFHSIGLDQVKVVLKPENKDFFVGGELNAPEFLANKFLFGMCLRNEPLPPIKVNQIHLPFIVTKKFIVINGQVIGELFSGSIQGAEFKIFDWLTPYPELQGDIVWKDIRLESIESWINFGKVKGSISGHFKNVVFQGTLPTQFNFLIQVLPNEKERQVVFSSKAMQNFVSLFTPSDINEMLPGVVRWFVFGWPSDMIGGFNIDYVGVSVYALDGSILLETLDPVGVVQNQKKHFILNGPRFKIPLVSRAYPVLLDAFGLSNFFGHLKSQLLSMSKNSENSTTAQPGAPGEEELKNGPNCQLPEL